MTTNRVPIRRHVARRVTSRAVELFRQASEQSSKGEDAPSELRMELHAELGLRLWQRSPLDVFSPVPGWISRVKQWEDSWNEMVALRKALFAAVEEERRRCK